MNFIEPHVNATFVIGFEVKYILFATSVAFFPSYKSLIQETWRSTLRFCTPLTFWQILEYCYVFVLFHPSSLINSFPLQDIIWLQLMSPASGLWTFLCFICLFSLTLSPLSSFPQSEKIETNDSSVCVEIVVINNKL